MHWSTTKSPQGKSSSCVPLTIPIWACSASSPSLDIAPRAAYCLHIVHFPIQPPPCSLPVTSIVRPQWQGSCQGSEIMQGSCKTMRKGTQGGTQGGHVHAFSISHIHICCTRIEHQPAWCLTLLQGIMPPPCFTVASCLSIQVYIVAGHQPASHSQWHHAGHHAAIIHPSCTQEDHATNATVGKRRWLEF